MESDRLNRWLTLAANFGVLVGIILLIAELNQNREIIRSQTRHQLTMGLIDMQISLRNDKELLEIASRDARGDDLSDSELERVNLLHASWIRFWEDVHYQYRHGLYDEIEFEGQKRSWKDQLQMNKGRTRFWCTYRERFSPEFTVELNDLLPADTC